MISRIGFLDDLNSMPSGVEYAKYVFLTFRRLLTALAQVVTELGKIIFERAQFQDKTKFSAQHLLLSLYVILIILAIYWFCKYISKLIKFH